MDAMPKKHWMLRTGLLLKHTSTFMHLIPRVTIYLFNDLFTAEKTRNIITVNIVGLQENAPARLPNVETIRRDVRRNRPNNHQAVADTNDTQLAHTTELHCGRFR